MHHSCSLSLAEELVRIYPPPASQKKANRGVHSLHFRWLDPPRYPHRRHCFRVDHRHHRDSIRGPRIHPEYRTTPKYAGGRWRLGCRDCISGGSIGEIGNLTAALQLVLWRHKIERGLSFFDCLYIIRASLFDCLNHSKFQSSIAPAWHVMFLVSENPCHCLCPINIFSVCDLWLSVSETKCPQSLFDLAFALIFQAV
jgi:hypothetical protein